MATKNRAGKPTIYTESDQILKDFSMELEELKSRMNQVEEEHDQNRYLIEQLAIQGRLSNELIRSQQEGIECNRENYGAIANVMHDLKSPVNDVVDNLAGIIDEIDDEETKDTLKDCMDTAFYVLDSFTVVEEFCTDVKGTVEGVQEVAGIRDFFKEKVSKLNSAADSRHRLRLLVDKSVPESTLLHTSAVERVLGALIGELQNLQKSTNITIAVSQERSGEKYDIDLSNLVVTIVNDRTTNLQWRESWRETVQSNRKLLVDSGFSLLKTKDCLRKIGGRLDLKTERNELRGFSFKIPLASGRNRSEAPRDGIQG